MNAPHSTSSYPSAVQGLGKQASDAMDTIGTATRELEASARDAAGKLTDAARDEAARLGHASRDVLGRAASSARDMATTVKQEAANVNDKAQRYVRDEPVKAILIAAAIGVALTSLVLLASRRH
jgi:ElaB/YqjD/DUF883 family membrane-anchored ribosome-binding protein